eukprot:SAG22_NODE_2_length_61565_cov_858.782010_65_plen_212_part_00
MVFNNVFSLYVNFAETLLIFLIGRKDLQKGLLVNRTDGGSRNAGRCQFGRPTTMETKDKIRKAREGTKHTPETCQLMSEVRKGMKKTKVTRKRISDKMSNVPKIRGTCSHCGIKGSVNNLKIYHDDLCLKRKGYEKRNRRYRKIINDVRNKSCLAKLENKISLVKEYFHDKTLEEKKDSGLYRVYKGSVTQTKKIWGEGILYNEVIDGKKK